jgi:uncharacterized repeat protein (TIGR03803 family)
MKTHTRQLSPLCGLIAVLILAVFGAQGAVVLTTLYSFTGTNDCANPNGLVQGSDGNFYGVTWALFRFATNGVLTSLDSFTNGIDGVGVNGLVQGSDGYFYGTTPSSGAYTNQSGQGYATVFKISTNGLLTSLNSFNDSDGAYPTAALVQGSDGYLYGTASGGGNTNLDDGFGYGTLFKVTTNGTMTNLHSFTGGNDGREPGAGLVQGSDGYFYGTTRLGGTNGSGNGSGTVFKISTNGEMTTLYSFSGGNDGAIPENGLVQGSDGSFYAATVEGGTTNLNSFGRQGYGTVFRISPNGALTSLYSFTGGNDGGRPWAGLVQGSDGNFYGTTVNGGGASNFGTVFKISTNGALKTLYTFGTITNANGDPLDGANPYAGLLQGRDGSFYGTTAGGTYGNGTVFRLTIVPDPQLTITPSDPYIILSWTGNYGAFSYAGYTLQSTTNLASQVWTTNSPAPVVVNGQNTVTNPISGTQQFFRLSR